MYKEKRYIMEEKNAVQYVQGKLFELQDLAYQKTVESYRITKEQKDYLKTLKIK